MKQTSIDKYGMGFAQIFLLIAITALSYSNTIQNEFVFDDIDVIFQDHIIKLDTIDFDNLVAVSQKSFHTTRPVAVISLALNYFFHQHNVAGYHIVNIAIHIVAGLFLFLLIKTTLGLPSLRSQQYSLRWLPFLSVLLWLVHPVQTQSVTYIVQRMNSMAAMFYIIALFAYVKGRLEGKRWRKLAFFGGAVVSGMMALGSKEIALTLPFFIVLYDWYFLQDLEFGRLKKYGLLVGGIVCLLVFSTFFFYLGKDPFSSLLAGYAGRDFTLAERLLTESRVVLFYMSLLILPSPDRLNLDHDFVVSQSLLAPPSTILSLAVLVLLLSLAVFTARNHRLLSFAIIWFFGNLAIESTVVPLEIIFDHRLYLPSTMLILALVASAWKYCNTSYVKVSIAFVLTVVSIFWTYQRNQVWSDELTLWSDCVKKSPEKARVHNNMATALRYVQPSPEKEEYHLLRAIELNQSYADAYHNLGNIRWFQGRFDEAVTLYSEAIGINPNVSAWYSNLGDALVKVWRLQEALEQFKKAMELDPSNAGATKGFYKVSRMIERNKKREQAKDSSFSK